MPTICVNVILRGDRVVRVVGDFVIKDIINNLECFVKMAPKTNKISGYPKCHANTFYGGIHKIGENKFIKVVSGDICKKIMIDGKCSWDIENDIVPRPNFPVDDAELLLSDCRFRLDRALLIKNDLQKADIAKLRIEELQRIDNKIRL